MKKIISLFLILIFTITAYASAFTDLSGYEWAEEEISYLTEKGIINGMGDGTFAPEQNVTREQLAKLVMGEFRGDSPAIDFADVTPDMWSYDAISKTNSLFKTDGTHFLPEQDATREETALVITKAVFSDVLEKIKPSDKNFSDIHSIEEKKTVQKAVALGIIEGYPDNTFRPEENVTRAECAVMLYRALAEKENYIEKEEKPVPEEEKVEAEKVGTIDDLEARSEFFVVKKVSTVADSDLQGVTGEQDGREYSLTINKAKIENQFYPEDDFVKNGDVIQIVKNSKNEIIKAYILFSPSMVYEGDYVVNPISDREKIIMNTSKKQDYAYGLVRNYKGSHIVLTFDNLVSTDDAELFQIKDEPNVYVYSRGKVYKGDEGDIMYDKTVGEVAYSEDASFVFLRAVDNAVTDIYVIENK